MGTTESTAYLSIQNKTDQNIIHIKVGIDQERGWYNGKGPYQFESGVKAGEIKKQKYIVYSHRENSRFSMEMTFSDKTVDIFDANMFWAFTDNTYSIFNHTKKVHCISAVHDKKERTFDIIVDYTPDQKVNNDAIKLKIEAELLMEKKIYEKAIELLKKALKLANQEETKMEINEKIELAIAGQKDEEAIALMKLGQKYMKKKQYDLAIEQLRKALNLANQTSTIASINENLKLARDKKAEQLKIEGDAYLKSEEYALALEKYNEALKIASYSTKLRTSIVDGKTTASYEYGLILMQKGWDLEMDMMKNNTAEAKKCFDEAITLFEYVVYQKGTPENQEKLKILKIKIAANKLFNEASEIEQLGSEIFDIAVETQEFDKYVKSHDKYKDALRAYKKARKKFEEGLKMGDKRFQISSDYVDTQIEAVAKVLNDFAGVKLNYIINSLQLSENDPLLMEIDKEDCENVLDVFWKIL